MRTARSVSPTPGGQERRRLEHDPAEPEVAELEEERQRLRELRRGRLGVTELAVDLREAPEHLGERAAVADRAQDVEALVGLRSSREVRARRDG